MDCHYPGMVSPQLADLSFLPGGLNFQSLGLNFQSLGLNFQSLGLNFQSLGLNFLSLGLNFQPGGLCAAAVGAYRDTVCVYKQKTFHPVCPCRPSNEGCPAAG